MCGVGEERRGKDLLVRAKVLAVPKKVGSYQKLITTAVGTGNFLRAIQSSFISRLFYVT